MFGIMGNICDCLFVNYEHLDEVEDSNNLSLKRRHVFKQVSFVELLGVTGKVYRLILVFSL